MREYHYAVDMDGRIVHDGTEIVDPATLRFFLRAMTRAPNGRYLVVCQGEHNFTAQDTPFVIQRLILTDHDGAVDSVELCLVGDYREPLDPQTLESDGDGVYCRVRRGAFRARFGRVALQQLTSLVGDGDGRPTLRVGNIGYPIRATRDATERSPYPGRPSRHDAAKSHREGLVD
jgi:hypothetical protein